MSIATIRDRPQPDNRSSDRSHAPMLVELRSHKLQAKNWSEHGFCIPACIPDGALDKVAKLKLHLDQGGNKTTLEVFAKARWTNTKHSLTGFSFHQLDEATLQHIQLAKEHALPIPQIDTKPTKRPSVPVETEKNIESALSKPDLKIESETKVKNNWLKTFAISAFYLTLGALLTTVLAAMFLANSTYFSVPTAFISRPITTIKAGMDSIILKSHVAENDSVKQGDVLFELQSDDINKSLLQAELELNEALLEQEKVNRQLSSDQSSLAGYKDLINNKLEASSIQLNASKSSLSNLKSELETLTKLRESGAVSELEYNDVKQRLDALAFTKLKAEADYKNLIKRQEHASRGRYYSDHRKEFDLKESRDLTDLAQLRVDMAQRRVESIQAHAVTTITAPMDGKISAVATTIGSRVERSDEILSLEATSLPVVEAYMTHKQLINIQLGETADVYIPAFDQRLQGIVHRISTTQLNSNDRQAYVNQSRNTDIANAPTAKVILTLDPLADDKLSQSLSGLPVEVTFQKQSALLRKFKSLVPTIYAETQ